jgi:WD40 repeat protein
VRVSRQGNVGLGSKLAVAPDGATIAVSGHQRSSGSWVRFWRLADGTPSPGMPDLTPNAEALAFTPDGDQLLVGRNTAGVSIVSPTSGQEVASVPAQGLICLAISADGQRVVAGLDNGEVLVWDLASRALQVTIKAHKGAVRSVGFLPGGESIFSAGQDLWGRLWNARDGSPVAKMKHGRKVITGAASPDGKRVATSCADKRIYLWDASDGREVLAIAAGRSAVQRLAWSPAGDVLVSAARSQIQLWNPANGDQLASLRVNSEVTDLAFSPDGACLFSGQGSTLRMWGLN